MRNGAPHASARLLKPLRFVQGTVPNLAACDVGIETDYGLLQLAGVFVWRESQSSNLVVALPQTRVAGAMRTACYLPASLHKALRRVVVDAYIAAEQAR